VSGTTFCVAIVTFFAVGCSSPPKPNYTRTVPEGANSWKDVPSMEHRPIETTRTNTEPKVDATVQEDPWSGTVEIKTWADEVIRGIFVSESADAYTLDVGSPTGAGVKLRRVPRSAVMDIKRVR
jgi:hypothetical protein